MVCLKRTDCSTSHPVPANGVREADLSILISGEEWRKKNIEGIITKHYKHIINFEKKIKKEGTS